MESIQSLRQHLIMEKRQSISRAGQLSLSINGVVQQPQDTSSPSVGYGVEADSTIVFSTAPVATDKVFGTFIGEVAASFDIEDNTIDNFTGDGSTTIFNLSKEVPSSQDVLVTLDGVTQHPSDASTTRSYSVIRSGTYICICPCDWSCNTGKTYWIRWCNNLSSHRFLWSNRKCCTD